MNMKKLLYNLEAVTIIFRTMCIMLLLLLLPTVSRGEQEKPAYWIKISYMDFSLQMPAVLDTRCVEFAYGKTPDYGFGFDVAVADIRVFYSIAPSKLGSNLSMFPVSLYYTPAVRWTPNYRAMPVTMFFLTYGRNWFPEEDSTFIANQNSITSGCFISWQKGIPFGLKASIIYTFSDDGETTCFTFGVGGIFSLGIFKGVGRRCE